MNDAHAARKANAGSIAVGLVAGGVCAAATIGVLLGLGQRSGAWWRPLNSAAHVILGARADGVWGFESVVTPTGVAVVLVMSAVAGVVAGWLAFSPRARDAALAAFAVTSAGYLVHVHLAARLAGGLGALLTVGELRAVYCTAAVALLAGTRCATVRNAGEPPR